MAIAAPTPFFKLDFLKDKTIFALGLFHRTAAVVSINYTGYSFAALAAKGYGREVKSAGLCRPCEDGEFSPQLYGVQ